MYHMKVSTVVNIQTLLQYYNPDPQHIIIRKLLKLLLNQAIKIIRIIFTPIKENYSDAADFEIWYDYISYFNTVAAPTYVMRTIELN